MVLQGSAMVPQGEGWCFRGGAQEWCCWGRDDAAGVRDGSAGGGMVLQGLGMVLLGRDGASGGGAQEWCCWGRDDAAGVRDGAAGGGMMLAGRARAAGG